MYEFCSYGNHPIVREKHGSYVVLTDEARGLKNVVCCKSCYREYILKFFPDSRMAEYVRNNPSEYPKQVGE